MTGALRDLNKLLGAGEHDWIEARAINDNGDVVGLWGTHGFLLKADGSVNRTGMGAMPDIEPVAINSRGDIGGTLKRGGIAGG